MNKNPDFKSSVIKPLDRWANRAKNIFQFLSKIIPISTALGVLAIPLILFYLEVRQGKRQQQFEQNLISAQADVRQQQAVREYLSQITAIYLKSDLGEKLRDNRELQELVEASTLALFNELSVREDSPQDLNDSTGFNFEATKKDRRGQVVEFLSGLEWVNINSLEKKEPLLSLEGANLLQSNLSGIRLFKADLRRANLQKSDLRGIEVSGANLRRADLSGANLYGANLAKADLRRTNLSKTELLQANLLEANLKWADLSGANLTQAYLPKAKIKGAELSGANLNNAIGLTNNQIKSACNWERAVHTEAILKTGESTKYIPKDKIANQQKIESIRQDKASDPKDIPNCKQTQRKY